MPMIRVEVMCADELPHDFALRVRNAFAAAFLSDEKHTDVRAEAVTHEMFSGHYDRGDEPVWINAIMAKLPEVAARRQSIRVFSESVASILNRDVSTIVVCLEEAPPDRLAFGGVLLGDL